MCGFYNIKVSKNTIHGNGNLKEERTLGERILFDRGISGGEQRAESSEIKKSKQEGSDAAQGPQTSDRERRQEGPRPGHEEPPSGRGQWVRGKMRIGNGRRIRPAQSGFYRCLLCYLHTLRKPTAKIHTLPRAL